MRDYQIVRCKGQEGKDGTVVSNLLSFAPSPVHRRRSTGHTVERATMTRMLVSRHENMLLLLCVLTFLLNSCSCV